MEKTSIQIYFVKIAIVISALQLSACAIGPLVGGEAARSNGKGRFELLGVKGNAGIMAVKWSLGLTENWDIGMQFETLSAGLRTKYAFINNQETGFSLAGAGGIGTNWGGSHYYGDFLMSYFINKTWEPYLIGRFVHVKNDPVKFRDEFDDDGGDWTIEADDFNYGQAILGLRFWPHAGWFLSGEVSHAFSMTNKVDFGLSVFAFINAGYRFQ